MNGMTDGLSSTSPSATAPTVALFVTCLVDLFRPSVGFAAIKLLEDAGCRVVVPASQTCCGQPAYNSGDRADTQAIARQVIETFEGHDYVVAPSGSCASTLKKHYPELFADEPEWHERATRFSAKVFELVSFLTDVRGVTAVDAALSATVTYHDSCSGLRELGIREQPRRLLKSVEGLTLKELPEADVCCGFGGTFCIKYPDVSNAIVGKKAKHVASTGAALLLAGDLGCLMNMDGKMKRENVGVEVRHVAEVLAGMTDKPPIGGKL
ncbi:(Fe-S)-binding protein [Jiella avicenniae]|uniref:(Fe-S)-binding protein n=1 Tax=Jiella avicenniae TaxID=2907202 RepID=A0A9X1NW35_9HYPH|nr:(Fe-S)-binding protein [Jiella avicenniae]MCE7026790.1 (Fe-S)-binding protein [Jiella avicenniae]